MCRASKRRGVVFTITALVIAVTLLMLSLAYEDYVTKTTKAIYYDMATESTQVIKGNLENSISNLLEKSIEDVAKIAVEYAARSDPILTNFAKDECLQKDQSKLDLSKECAEFTTNQGEYLRELNLPDIALLDKVINDRVTAGLKIMDGSEVNLDAANAWKGISRADMTPYITTNVDEMEPRPNMKYSPRGDIPLGEDQKLEGICPAAQWCGDDAACKASITGNTYAADICKVTNGRAQYILNNQVKDKLCYPDNSKTYIEKAFQAIFKAYFEEMSKQLKDKYGANSDVRILDAGVVKKETSMINNIGECSENAYLVKGEGYITKEDGASCYRELGVCKDHRCVSIFQGNSECDGKAGDVKCGSGKGACVNGKCVNAISLGSCLKCNEKGGLCVAGNCLKLTPAETGENSPVIYEINIKVGVEFTNKYGEPGSEVELNADKTFNMKRIVRFDVVSDTQPVLHAFRTLKREEINNVWKPEENIDIDSKAICHFGLLNGLLWNPEFKVPTDMPKNEKNPQNKWGTTEEFLEGADGTATRVVKETWTDMSLHDLKDFSGYNPLTHEGYLGNFGCKSDYAAEFRMTFEGGMAKGTMECKLSQTATCTVDNMACDRSKMYYNLQGQGGMDTVPAGASKGCKTWNFYEFTNGCTGSNVDNAVTCDARVPYTPAPSGTAPLNKFNSIPLNLVHTTSEGEYFRAYSKQTTPEYFDTWVKGISKDGITADAVKQANVLCAGKTGTSTVGDGDNYKISQFHFGEWIVVNQVDEFIQVTTYSPVKEGGVDSYKIVDTDYIYVDTYYTTNKTKLETNPSNFGSGWKFCLEESGNCLCTSPSSKVEMTAEAKCNKLDAPNGGCPAGQTCASCSSTSGMLTCTPCRNGEYSSITPAEAVFSGGADLYKCKPCPNELGALWGAGIDAVSKLINGTTATFGFSSGAETAEIDKTEVQAVSPNPGAGVTIAKGSATDANKKTWMFTVPAGYIMDGTYTLNYLTYMRGISVPVTKKATENIIVRHCRNGVCDPIEQWGYYYSASHGGCKNQGEYNIMLSQSDIDDGNGVTIIGQTCEKDCGSCENNPAQLDAAGKPTARACFARVLGQPLYNVLRCPTPALGVSEYMCRSDTKYPNDGCCSPGEASTNTWDTKPCPDVMCYSKSCGGSGTSINEINPSWKLDDLSKGGCKYTPRSKGSTDSYCGSGKGGCGASECVCDGAGGCKRKDIQSCTASSQCASGFCCGDYVISGNTKARVCAPPGDTNCCGDGKKGSRETCSNCLSDALTQGCCSDSDCSGNHCCPSGQCRGCCGDDFCSTTLGWGKGSSCPKYKDSSGVAIYYCCGPGKSGCYGSCCTSASESCSKKNGCTSKSK